MAERFLFLDTETTGLSVTGGDRVCEIAVVEADEKGRAIRAFHTYLNPECRMNHVAQSIHGLSTSFLLGAPRFAEIQEEFLAFVKGATIVAHNATFDQHFIEGELARAGGPSFFGSVKKIECSWRRARSLLPVGKRSLEALCERFEIGTIDRSLHGALIDSVLLGHVWASLTALEKGGVMPLPVQANLTPEIRLALRQPRTPKLVWEGPIEA